MSVSAGQVSSNTAQTFLTALITNAALLAIEVGTFIVLKERLGRIYSPRTYLPPPDKRSEKLPDGPWRWIPAVLKSPLKDIIHKNGLDAYMFLRFIRLLVRVFLVFSLITVPILMPIDAVGINTGRTGLDRITWSNLADSNEQIRFVAHMLLAYVLTFTVLYAIQHEMLHFVHMRHQFLLSKSHSRLPQARTVLVTSVPDELANEHDLRTFASFTPGGVDRVWLYRDTKALNENFEARRKACKKLEGASSKILRQAAKAWRIKEKNYQREQKSLVKRKHDIATEKLIMPPPSQELMDELVPLDQRPKHRIGFLGILGHKVDTYNSSKNEIARLNVIIKEAREHIVKGKFLGSAFIRCNLQMGAHVLAQCVSYHEPLMMYDKWMEANPKDIVWDNLDDGAIEMRSRYVISWLATIGLIIAWAFPVALIGTLSNLEDLCQRVRWLAWVCKAPKPLPGFIQGVLPPAIFAGLFALLPFILRGLAWYECIPRYSLISVSVYKRYFIFLVIHGFLIVTVTSGITKAIEDILEQPAQTVSKLAQELPGASVFFLTYMVTQGLAGAGSALIQLMPLIIHYIRKWFLGRTPRQAYGVTFLMPAADFGIILPQLSLLATIGFAYSVITPLINILALITYATLYIAWKFLFTQVFDQPDECETGGLYFPMAISNLFVGLYIKQICLACLFFLKISVSRASSLAGGILMLMLFALTLATQMFVRRSFNPITNFLPMSLATKKMAKRYEQQHQKRLGAIAATEDEIDLFSRDRIRSIKRRVEGLPKKLEHRLGTLKLPDKRSGKLNLGADKDMEVQQDRDDTQTRQLGIVRQRVISSAALATKSEMSRNSVHSVQSNKSRESQEHRKSGERVGPIPRYDYPGMVEIGLTDDDPSGEEEVGDDDEHAFDHPSTYVEQAWIWIPKDPLGLSEVLIADLRAAGVEASDLGAVMDRKGVVEVTRNPPDEEWMEGHDI